MSELEAGARTARAWELLSHVRGGCGVGVGGDVSPPPSGRRVWMARSFEPGEESFCYRRRSPSFPGLPEIPAARRSLPSFSLLAELPFRPCAPALSFCPPLRLSSLGSFLLTGPRRVGSDFPSLSVPFLHSAPVRLRSLEPSASSSRSRRRANHPGLLPLFSVRRRETRGVANSPSCHLSSSRGAVSWIVPASRGAAGRGRSVAGIVAFHEDLPAFLCSIFSP